MVDTTMEATYCPETWRLSRLLPHEFTARIRVHPSMMIHHCFLVDREATFGDYVVYTFDMGSRTTSAPPAPSLMFHWAGSSPAMESVRARIEGCYEPSANYDCRCYMTPNVRICRCFYWLHTGSPLEGEAWEFGLWRGGGIVPNLANGGTGK